MTSKEEPTDTDTDEQNDKHPAELLQETAFLTGAVLVGTVWATRAGGYQLAVAFAFLTGVVGTYTVVLRWNLTAGDPR